MAQSLNGTSLKIKIKNPQSYGTIIKWYFICNSATFIFVFFFLIKGCAISSSSVTFLKIIKDYVNCNSTINKNLMDCTAPPSSVTS